MSAINYVSNSGNFYIKQEELASPIFQAPKLPKSSIIYSQEPIKYFPYNKNIPTILKQMLGLFDEILKSSLQLSGLILHYLGTSIVIYQTCELVFTFLKILSFDDIVGGRALAKLFVAAALMAFGEALRKENDVHIAIGNLLYIPLDYVKRKMLN